jgi:hypothetical protein
VNVTVDEPRRRVTVRLQQRHDLWFARIFGANDAPVGALAAAHVQLSGTAPCVQPFAIEHDVYTDADIFKKVLLWEQSGGAGQNKDNEEGHSRFILIGKQSGNPGNGHEIYNMITDRTCEYANIKVGDEVYRKPGNNTLGNVQNGLKDLEKWAKQQGYGELTWSESETANDGFNKPDYLDDPRVVLVPMYDPATLRTPYTGTDQVTITGFLRVALLTKLVECQNNSKKHPPCQFPGNDNREQLYAIVLPSVGLSDTCEGQGCSKINRTLQLIQ